MIKRAESADYLQIFLNDIPLIDMRSPTEFEHGSFPNAINLPILFDEERQQVGICYKEQGQQSAIDLGLQLVSGEMKDQRLIGWKNFAEKNPEGYLFCFRGGLRSHFSQQWLRESGINLPRVLGGYKAMRHYLIDALTVSCEGPVTVLSGQTGCAKTQLLQELKCAVDLEKLANHRGSAFGKRVGGQPSQIDFENCLSIAMLKQRHTHSRLPVILEDESHLIGKILIPDIVMLTMQKAPLVMIETPLEERVEHTYQNYILHKLIEWQEVYGEQQGFTLFAEELLTSLSNLKRRLGGWRFQQLAIQMQSAIDQHSKGNSIGHLAWIGTLLKEYYDPMYQYQLSQKTDRVIFQGSYSQVQEFLQHHQKNPI